MAVQERVCDFVVYEPRRRHFLRDVNILCAGGGEHFRGLGGDVPGHDAFVFVPGAMDFQGGDSPRVKLFLVDLDIIIVIGQAFAETANAHAPGAGHFQGIFELGAHANFAYAARPDVAVAAALVAVTAQKIFLPGLYVSKARDVNAVGAVAERHFIFMAGHFAAGAAAHVVIHQIVAEFSAGIGEAVGEFGSRGIEEHARGLEGRAANEKDAGLELERAFGLRVNDANTADAARIRIETAAVHHAVRAQGETGGLLRQAFGLGADAGELFHVVVPGGDVRVADGPIDGDSLFQVGFEVEIAPAIALSSPGDGFAADLAAANPGEMFSGSRGIRIVLVADKKLVRVLIASVVALALNGLSGLAFVAIVPPTVLHFPNGNVLDIVSPGHDAAARVEDEWIEALFSEFIGGPAAADSRANNDCVLGCGRHVCLYPYASPDPGAAGTQPCCAPGMICNLSS